MRGYIRAAAYGRLLPVTKSCLVLKAATHQLQAVFGGSEINIVNTTRYH